MGEEKLCSQFKSGLGRYKADTMCGSVMETESDASGTQGKAKRVREATGAHCSSPRIKLNLGFSNTPGCFKYVRDVFPLLVKPAWVTYYRNNPDSPSTYLYRPLIIIIVTRISSA